LRHQGSFHVQGSWPTTETGGQCHQSGIARPRTALGEWTAPTDAPQGEPKRGSCHVTATLVETALTPNPAAASLGAHFCDEWHRRL